MASLRRRYILLDETCPASEIPRMMCRVVQDVQLPLFKYAPVEPIILADALEKQERSHNPSDLIPSILPEASLMTNRKDFLLTIRNKSVKAKVSKIFCLHGGLNHEQKVDLETKGVRRYALSNAGEYFNALMRDELYARDVRALLKKTSFGRAYLVVGFLTTTNAKWNHDGSSRSTVELRGALPVNAIAAAAGAPLPVIVDPSFSAKNDVTHISNRSHDSPDEEIFAVAYAPVKTSVFDRRKKEVRIGRAMTATPNHLAFGESDDDDDDEEDYPARNVVDHGDGEIQLGENDDDFAESLEVEGFEF